MELVCRKPVGQLGRIVLPDIIRERMNMESGTVLDMYLDENAIVIKRSDDQTPISGELVNEFAVAASENGNGHSNQ